MTQSTVWASHGRASARPRRSFGAVFWAFLSACLIVSASLLGDFANITPAYAATKPKPNPAIAAPAWLKSPQAVKPPDPGKYVQGHPNPAQQHISTPQRPQASPTIFLTPQAQHVVTKDGHLQVDVPADTVSAQQVQDAGGRIQLKIVQVDAGSGGGASGQLVLGTYQLSLFDAKGNALTTLVLAHPLTLHYRVSPKQGSALWKNQTIVAAWNSTATTSSTQAPSAQAQTNMQASSHKPIPMVAKKDATALSWSIPTTLTPSLPVTQPTTTATPAVKPATTATPAVKPTATATPSAKPTAAVTPTTLATPKGTATPQATATPTAKATPTGTASPTATATPQATPTATPPAAPVNVTAAAASSTITFNTESPVASWGSPQNVDVGLSSGSLDYSYPISVPPGPGGFAPNLTLAYSSGSVSESHNAQGTAPWVGEGWNLSLGSITWTELNQTPGGTNDIQDMWTISDSNGISGQLIPPGYTESATSIDGQSTFWHSAPESHARIQQANFNGQPCWHVWLPNGMIEEFGCTNESRQSATDAQGNFHPYRWDLNLLVDRFGNQIRVHYQQDRPNNGDVRDSVISFIEYDDPTCHNASYAVGGGVTLGCSSWNPLITIALNAKYSADRILNTTAGCANWAQYIRCDVPADLSGSGGLPAPKAFNDYILNNIRITSNGGILHEYDFSYDQKPGFTIQDPLSGLNESVAGYLLLRRIQENGTDNTALNAPVVNIAYTAETEHYEASDTAHHALPLGNCGPSWTPRYATNDCWLWAQTYNKYFIQNFDNGRGWNETVNWAEAHGNTHGADTGLAANDAVACNPGRSSTNLCGQADDRSWSRMVVSNRTAVTNGVSSPWSYNYYVNALTATWCPNCTYGYTWGNVNDEDYADYYNEQFTSFATVDVTQPDNSTQRHNFYSTSGPGIAKSGITCYYKYNGVDNCGVSPYWGTDPGLAGREKEALNFGTDGKLLSAQTWYYLTMCPPPGVGHSAGAAGLPYDVGDQYMTSQLDRNNPVMVCDPRVAHTDQYQVDGITDKNGYQSNAGVLHKTTTYTYDGDNQGSSDVNGYDYGNVNQVDVTANDVNNEHYISTSSYYPNDNVLGSVYLTNLSARTSTNDAAGTQYGCHVNFYGGASSYTTPPTLTNVTRMEDHTGYSDPTNGCAAPGSLIVNLTNFDSSGVPTSTVDPDSHKGCQSNTYTACASYDGLDTHLTKAYNAKNQMVQVDYNSTASGGYGQWVMATKDANGQSTAYQYDVLGRLTAVAAPGDTLTSPTTSYTYKNTCTQGSTAPCLELDTTTRIVSGGTQTVTTQQWYDGQGRLIETKAPGPNLWSKVPKISSTLITYTIYDKMGRANTKSLPYAISALSGTGYITPDQAQARTVTNYDGLGRPLGSATYKDTSTIVLSTSVSYQVANALPGFTKEQSTTPFERTITVDAYNHQSISYVDALGRHRYDQVFTGTNPYTVVRTIQYNRDTVGNLVSTNTFDATSTIVASQHTTYDGVGRKVGMNDSDSGNNWAYSYDGDGNLLSQTDPRGTSTYASYDVLNRPLCKGTTSASVNPCSSSAYATFFYDSYDNSGNTGVAFPSGCTAPTGSFASDPIGKETSDTFRSTAGSGWRCSGYDERGRPDQNSLSVTADGTTTNQTVNASYNDAGQLTTLNYPDGELVTSQYDNNGNLRSAYFGGAGTTDPVTFLVGQVSYTNAGQLAGMAFGGTGLITTVPTPTFSTTLSYDGIQRPVTSTANRSGTTFWSQTRTYDNVGNVINLNTTVPTTTNGTKTDSQSFCYDDLNRLVWSGNTGTPTGGNHCGLAPNGTTVSAYQQSYSYDALDRLTNGPSGSETYGTFPTHGATTLGTVPNQYASYDAMGNMTCRNVDTTSGHSCDAAQSGAIMTYDNEGRLDTWVAPNGTVASDHFLYDNAGHRVLQSASNTVGSTTTTSDTISFDGFTDVTITGSTTSTTKYYSVGGQRVAMRQDGTFSYLMPDFLGSTNIALRSDGSVQAVQLFSPFGATRYSDGTMVTPFNFTGQRLDTQTGLLYYNARYYDANSGRFTSADTVETNGSGLDPFAYVKGNPETFVDPTGHGRCGPDGDCVGVPGPGTPGQPTPPPPPPPGVGGVDDACHNMALCGSGGNGGSGGDSSPTTAGSTGCHSGCNFQTTDSGNNSGNDQKDQQSTCVDACHEAAMAKQSLLDNNKNLRLWGSVHQDIANLLLDALAIWLDWGNLLGIAADLASALPHVAHLLADISALNRGDVPASLRGIIVAFDQMASVVNLVKGSLWLFLGFSGLFKHFAAFAAQGLKAIVASGLTSIANMLGFGGLMNSDSADLDDADLNGMNNNQLISTCRERKLAQC